MLDKKIKNNSSNVKIDKRPKDPKKNPYGKDKPYINNLRVDDNGMWDPANRSQPIMVMGNSMSTEGYGNMPLYVQPNGGNRGFIVPPNVGTLNFGPGVSHFVETPMMQEGGNYNTKRALELGYQPDKTGHWPSVDDQTGMWLKSKQHPTAWMEYLYGYALNPEVQEQFKHPIVNPEGYFGENQLQYVPKQAYGGDPSLPNITGHYKFGGKYSKTETHMKHGGWLNNYQNGGSRLQSSPANIIRDFEGGSYYDPVADTIYLNSIRGDFDLPHELYHRQQMQEGRLRIPEADPYGEARRKPSMLEEQEQVDYPYYNRRAVDQDILTQDFFTGASSGVRNPSFHMIPYDMVYERAINPQMYREPWTAEGEAELTESPEGEQELIERGIGPNYDLDMYYRYGGLPKAQDGKFRMDYGDLRKPIKETAISSNVVKGLGPKPTFIDPKVTSQRKAFEQAFPLDYKKEYTELEEPERGTIRQQSKQQSKLSKAYEVFKNPITAGSYVVNNQRIPDYFSEGETANLDIPVGFSPAHLTALTAESIYGLGKAALDPETYKNMNRLIQSGVTPGSVSPAEYIESLTNLSPVALDAVFSRMGYKGGKKMVNQHMRNEAAKGMKKWRGQNPYTPKPKITGKMEGLGTKADALIPKGKRYGPIATPVFEGKYPAQSPTGNIKGDLFDLRNTGYTDVPGFNKQVQDLKRRAEFGVRPLETKLPSQKKMREFTDELIDKSRGMETDFHLSADELRDLQLKKFSGKDAFKMIEPNKQGGQIKLKKRKGTSQNVQSSVNEIMMRNELIFGPPGKRKFIPYKQDGGESDITGGWLDNYV